MPSSENHHVAVGNKWLAPMCRLLTKIVLSVIMGMILFVLLQLSTFWRLMHSSSTKQVEAPRAANIPAHKEAAVIKDRRIFWPTLPGSANNSFHEMILNGIEMLSEEFDSSMPQAEVIAYYRRQMASRGWQDMTEATYKFQPESRDTGESKNGLQDQEYLQLYRATVDSTLIMSRDAWSLHVTTAPSQDPIRSTAVRVYAAATPSLETFVESLASPQNDGMDESSMGRPIETVQKSAGYNYHTTIKAKREELGQAFQNALSDLRTKKWFVLNTSLLPSGRASPCAWLVKGEQYAVLSVVASRDGQSSSVTLIEVTPEQLQR